MHNVCLFLLLSLLSINHVAFSSELGSWEVGSGTVNAQRDKHVPIMARHLDLNRRCSEFAAQIITERDELTTFHALQPAIKSHLELSGFKVNKGKFYIIPGGGNKLIIPIKAPHLTTIASLAWYEPYKLIFAFTDVRDQ